MSRSKAIRGRAGVEALLSRPSRRFALVVVAVSGLVACSTGVQTRPPDADRGTPAVLDVATIESVLGVTAELIPEEGVAKVSFPRTDVPVTIEGRPMEPFMGLTSWAAFQKGKKPGVEAMLMGDLVLFEDEVNPTMSVALEHGLEVTALHNHFFFDQPKVYFMHIGGEGGLAAMCEAIRLTLAVPAQVREKGPPARAFDGPLAPRDSRIDGTPIAAALGHTGVAKDGMYKVVIGRETTVACGCTVGKAVGVNTWASFAGAQDQAVVDGDFAVLEGELVHVLRALRSHDINVVAIHHHMLFEEPRIIFLHYWGKGTVAELARGLRAAMDRTSMGREHARR